MKTNQYKPSILALVFTIGVSGWFFFSSINPETQSVYAQGEFVEPLDGTLSPFAEVADAVMPCVVGVSNRANTFNLISGQTQLIEQATGSGVVITTQGHVVTNHHVVKGASDVQVLWQGRYLSAEIVGVDELTDLAVLRVTEDVSLPAVLMGEPDQVRPGDWAIVIGNPLGKQFADTVTVGVVSALNRELEESPIVKMIQTDAAINSGNSGGGMFNTKGELIGIPSLKFSASSQSDMASIEGIAMAIPMDVVKPVVTSIIQYGKVIRPRLGIAVMTMRGAQEPKEGVLPAGVYVSAVEEGGAAYRAGIQKDDIILKIDGIRVMQHTDMTNRIASQTAGQTIRITVYRIPGLAELTFQDRIPEGKMLDIDVELELFDQSM